MSAAPEVINPQNVTDIARCWRGVHLDRKDSGKSPLPAKLLSGDASSSSDELNAKVRKPYTITKQRERWTETEHQNFLEALRLHGRAWRRIEEYIGTKTAVQIRSHAQKFFSKLEREASNGSSGGKLPDIAIPPPRPKRKPNHPYPKKAGSSPPVLEDESKETLLLSSAGIGAAHSEGFQFGSFNPCMGRGGTTAIGSPVAGGQFLGSQGSVKIFGRTVSVPKTNEAGFHDCSSFDRFVSEDNADVPKQSSVAEPKQIVGFIPFVKVRSPSVDSFPEPPACLDRDGSCSGATQSEGTSESLRRTCEHDLAGVNTEAADSVTFCGKDCKVSRDPDLGKLERGLMAAGMKEGEKGDVQFSQSMNPAIHSWINNFLHYHSGVAIPPIPASGAVDGPTSNSLSYWHFIQASAVNYAAYTAAMAAAAAAGWKASTPGGPDSADSAKVNTNEFQLPSVQLPWWPYSTFIPPVNISHPVDAPLAMDPLQQGVNLDSQKGSLLRSSEKIVKSLKETQLQGEESDTGLQAAAEVAEICESAAGVTDGEINDCTKAKSSAQMGSRFETSCLTEASGFTKGFAGSVTQLDAEAVFMPAKLCMQGSDTEMRVSPTSLQNAYSSSDELEEGGKKQGEGSSSGSNNPASRCPSGDWDAPIIIESKKRDCCTLSGDNDDSCSGAFQISHQLCVTNTADLPKLRLKHAEKSRKHHQPRDSRHADDSKRLKSCAHELELRKEVSQEGRKAFQALFTSKLLPQTFPSAGDRDDHVSRPTVSKNESRLNDCIQFRVSQENIIREGDNLYNAANLEMSNEFQGPDGQPEVTRNGFTVSSSSGFVPYRRLVCPQPLKLAEPASL